LKNKRKRVFSLIFYFRTILIEIIEKGRGEGVKIAKTKILQTMLMALLGLPRFGL
jgi:hypothetical protein